MSLVIAAFGGALRRTPSGWRWRDGRSEPRVFDVTAMQAYELPRVVRVRDGVRVEHASLRARLAQAEPDLAAFLQDAGAQASSPDDDPGAIEVPWSVWEAWAKERVVGVRWDEADEDDLLREANAQQAR
ncbi:MAG: hypothetical protein U0325_17505 [Polyangiales bacterium]